MSKERLPWYEVPIMSGFEAFFIVIIMAIIISIMPFMWVFDYRLNKLREPITHISIPISKLIIDVP